MATLYAARAFKYKKDSKIYTVGKPVEIDDKEVESYVKRNLVTTDKPKSANKDTEKEKAAK